MKKAVSFAVFLVAVAVIALWRIPSFSSKPMPVASFEEALARFESLRQAESTHPLRPEGASRLLHHGKKTDRVFVLLHGLTNCPEQFVQFAEILHAKGANVVIPRARLAGYADRLNDDQGHQTAQDLIDQAATGLDLAAGLGDRVTLIGLSGSAVAAGWMAQNREGIDEVILISPFFGLYGIPSPVVDGAAVVLSRLPNFYQWWDASQKENLPGPLHTYPRFGTHCMADTVQLSRDVRAHLEDRPLLAKRIVFLTTASDRGANNELTNSISNRLKVLHGDRVVTFEFPESLAVPHDMIDPAQPDAKTDLTYAKILELSGL
jgi:carboxylesterase